MQVAVVIPCHGGVADTRACLASLSEQEGVPDLRVVLVDNASEDGTADLDREAPWPPVRVLRQETNLGFAGGVNVGLAHAAPDADVLVVLNNDTQAAPRMLQRLVATLAQDHTIGMAAPVSNHVKGEARIDVGDRGSTLEGRLEVQQLLEEFHGGVVQDLRDLAGTCLALRTDFLRDVGGFDERYGLGNFEDDDLSLRARLAGWRLVVVRDAFLHHEGHRTFQHLGLDYREQIEARRAVYLEKWHGHPVMAALHGGETPRAAAAARETLRRHPDWIDGPLILGRCARADGDHAAAAAHLEAFLRRCPAHREARIEHALCRIETGDEAGGRLALERALQELPFDAGQTAWMLLQLARQALAHARPAEVQRHLDELDALADLSPETRNDVGALWLQLGDAARARPHLQSATEGGAPLARGNLGACLWHLGQHADALRELARALAERPDDERVRANLGMAVEAARAAGIDVEQATRLL